MGKIGSKSWIFTNSQLFCSPLFYYSYFKYKPLAHKPTRSNVKDKLLIKWLIPNYMYNETYFPYFLSGSGYLVPQEAATCLLQKSKVCTLQMLRSILPCFLTIYFEIKVKDHFWQLSTGCLQGENHISEV